MESANASPQVPLMRTLLSPSPSRVPLPPSETASRRGSTASSARVPANGLLGGGFTTSTPPPLVVASPRTVLRPRLDRSAMSLMSSSMAIGPTEDPFWEGATITVDQPVGSLSISPNSRDVCLASRKGLYILDLKNLENAPRFVPQGGRWQIADCQWSPHSVTDNLILSTSSFKLLVWDLAAQVPLLHSVDAHERAITDINWHAINPQLMATVAMDAGIRAWDLRLGMQRPIMRLSAWGAAGTQVKWNRRAEHVLATAHGKDVLVWDDRKGSMPLEVLKAHDAKIYGIDWDRRLPNNLVTCSLDKTIKQWDIPALRTGNSDNYALPNASEAFTTQVITTGYPVWRARNLPFGYGVLSLPQRGETALEMFGINNPKCPKEENQQPVERFEGSLDLVKEFVWRVRGGDDPDHEDRDFQLVTWSKDRKLRVWPVAREVTERVGYKRGGPITVFMSRTGARDVTFTVTPGATCNSRVPLPIVDNHTPAPPSGIARQRLLANSREAGMTRGGKQKSEIDQIEWLTKVVKTGKATASSESGTGPPSRAPSTTGDSNGSRSRSRTRLASDAIRPLSVNRAPTAMSRSASNNDSNDSVHPEPMLLKDEVLLVHKMFPKSKVNFEKFDLVQRKLTMSLNGPWANGDRFAFIRIHWSFPPNYPYGSDIPTFELEKNATVASITRHRMVSTIKEIRAQDKQCLVAVTEFLLGYHERTGRRRFDDDAMSDSDSPALEQNVPMLVRSTGAVFGPNGQLACFFPKHTVLPRARTSLSRSPSGRNNATNPLLKAITALSRMESPNKPTTMVRYRRHARRLKAMMGPVQARSTLTLHNVSHLLSEPDPTLAAQYVTTSVEANLLHALEAKRLDHAEVWGSLRSILTDPPPPYTDHPPLRRGAQDTGEGVSRSERSRWQRDMERKRRVLDEMFDRLMEAGDIQLLALVSCVLLEYERTAPPPPHMLSVIAHSPEQDYFVLPPTVGPPGAVDSLMRRHSSVSPATPPIASAGPSSFRTSGWSQMLMNPSSISLRGMTLTPRDRTSFDVPRTPKDDIDDGSPAVPPRGRGMTIPRHESMESVGVMGSASKSAVSPRRAERRESMHRRDSLQRQGRDPRPRPLNSTSLTNASGFVSPTPAARAEREAEGSAEGSYGASGWSSISTRAAKVSFGSASPLRRAFSGPGVPTPAPLRHLPERRRRIKGCSVRIELVAEGDEEEGEGEDDDAAAPKSLLRREILPLAEVWKLAYADFLFRAGLVGRRAALLQYSFHSVDAGDTGRDPEATSGSLGCQSLVFGAVCQSCHTHPLLPGEARCTNCRAAARPTPCAVCREPIKGLATTCTVCAHTSHFTCLRHFMAQLSGDGQAHHCPACACDCQANKGLSGSFLTAPRPREFATALTYGFSPSPERVPPGVFGLGLIDDSGFSPPPPLHGGVLLSALGRGHNALSALTSFNLGGGGAGEHRQSRSSSPTHMAFDAAPLGSSPEQRRKASAQPAGGAGGALELTTHARSLEDGVDWEDGSTRERERRDTLVAPVPQREGLLSRTRLRALGTDGILGW